MKSAIPVTIIFVLTALLLCFACLRATVGRESAAVDPGSSEAVADNAVVIPPESQRADENAPIDPKSPETAAEAPAVYITPEQFGAVGDGVADDTAAFEQCMQSSEKYVLLTGTYLIKGNISASLEKYFYAPSENGETGATIICEPVGTTETLTFAGNVTIENVEFYSRFLRTGKSPHGETYQRSSLVIFVEIWNESGTFTNCTFYNALTAIRGRKSTNATVIPKRITVSGCSFIECKIAIQGFSENTMVTNCAFLNDGELFRKLDSAAEDPEKYNGDLYSGDHCVYMERYGCRSLIASNCRVDTKNCTSGHAFQIYGEPKSGDIIPELRVENCLIHANGIASASAANATIENCIFYEQRNEQYIARIETGTLTLRNSEFNHAYSFTDYNSIVKPYAENCTFTRMSSLGTFPAGFPQESVGCTFIDWGGYVIWPDTRLTDCTFTRTGDRTLGGLYISNSQGYSVYLKNTRFQSGDKRTNNDAAVRENIGCSTFD